MWKYYCSSRLTLSLGYKCRSLVCKSVERCGCVENSSSNSMKKSRLDSTAPTSSQPSGKRLHSQYTTHCQWTTHRLHHSRLGNVYIHITQHTVSGPPTDLLNEVFCLINYNQVVKVIWREAALPCSQIFSRLMSVNVSLKQFQHWMIHTSQK